MPLLRDHHQAFELRNTDHAQTLSRPERSKQTRMLTGSLASAPANLKQNFNTRIPKTETRLRETFTVTRQRPASSPSSDAPEDIYTQHQPSGIYTNQYQSDLNVENGFRRSKPIISAAYTLVRCIQRNVDSCNRSTIERAFYVTTQFACA